jgi:hypothetical protein
VASAVPRPGTEHDAINYYYLITNPVLRMV